MMARERSRWALLRVSEGRPASAFLDALSGTRAEPGSHPASFCTCRCQSQTKSGGSTAMTDGLFIAATPQSRPKAAQAAARVLFDSWTRSAASRRQLTIGTESVVSQITFAEAYSAS